jgi:hypothetical protein
VKRGVFFAVRPEFLNIIYMSFGSQLIQAVAVVHRLCSKGIRMTEAFLSLTVVKTVETGSAFDIRAR